MRKRLAVVVVALLSAATVIAAQGPAAAATRHVHAFAPYTKATDVAVDNAPAGPSVGDEHSGNFRLFNHGKSVGNFDYSCVRTSVDPGREECRASVHFRNRGKMTIEGNTKPSGNRDIVAITGGTGQFAGARGTAVLNFRRHGGHFRFNLQ
jgi:hypothetical protein